MSGSAFYLEITAHRHALVEAADVLDLSPNVVGEAPGPGLEVPCASFVWPSYFCDRGDVVRMLTYLLQHGLPFDIDVWPDGLAGPRYRLHPPLDPHTRDLLAEVDPKTASRITDWETRIDHVFRRLRAAASAD
jgi:hypothetical protein